MKRLLSVLITAALLLSLSSCVTARDSAQEYLENEIRGMNFSGVILVTKNGQVVCQKASGMEKTPFLSPVSLDTLFCVGSVSKQFAAAAVMLLQEDGKLSVNDRLSRFFPDYAYGKDLTVHNLLSMRSGITEFYGVTYIDDAFTEIPTNDLEGIITNQATPAENKAKLEQWLFRQPLDFEPDTEGAYSNSNYFLLARIVECVSETSYNDFVRERIFEPLGMNHSVFIDDVELQTLPHLAAPSVNPKTVYVGVTMGLGDIITNARDMDKWLTSFRTHKLLSAESVSAMMTDYSREGEIDSEYGYGLIPDRKGGAYHNGYITTYYSMDYCSPEQGINLFAVTNDDVGLKGSLNEVCWGVLDRISDTAQ